MTISATTTTPLTSFEVGSIYSVRSICDHNAVWTYKVVSRTAKQVTLQEIGEAQLLRRGIIVYENVETCFPSGKYSMAPILKANRKVDV